MSNQQWDRMKGESGRNYAHFEAYRLMGADRSLLGAYNAHLAQKGQQKRINTPSSWRKAFDLYNWKTRAEKWDSYSREQNRHEDEEFRQRMQNGRKKIIEKSVNLVREALDKINLESPKFGEIMTGIKMICELTKAEFGDGPITTPLSYDIFEALISSEITVREAALRYNQEGLALPKALEIMLKKEPPEETSVDESVGIITEDELDRIYEERIAASEAQETDFLPQRKAEVEELKVALADQDQWTDV